MDELIVRVMRAVACATRLRVLSCLAGVEELPPSKLARELHIARGLLAVHLARLAAAGLVQRRRSGTWCYCSARSPYGEGTLSGEVAAWLRGALARGGGTADAAARRDRRSLAAEPLPKAHRLVFHAATAFTHPRRIHILRRLAAGGALDVPTLTRDLKMSQAAVGRHLEKLIRRGYVRALPPTRRGSYELLRGGKSGLHASLLAILSTHWGERSEPV